MFIAGSLAPAVRRQDSTRPQALGLLAAGETQKREQVREGVGVLRGRDTVRAPRLGTQGGYRLTWQTREDKRHGHPALMGLQCRSEPGQSQALTCRCGPWAWGGGGTDTGQWGSPFVSCSCVTLKVESEQSGEKIEMGVPTALWGRRF